MLFIIAFYMELGGRKLKLMNTVNCANSICDALILIKTFEKQRSTTFNNFQQDFEKQRSTILCSSIYFIVK